MSPVLAENRKSRHDYAILQTYECGIVLLGTETKAIKSGGKIQFADSHVKLLNGELYLINCFISKYSHGTHDNHEETRTRKLLLHKREIIQISHVLQDVGVTIIPIKFFTAKNKIKLEIALAKGKKSHEKRDDLKRKAVEMDLKKNFKQSQLKIR